MIQISYSQLCNHSFAQSVQKLAQTQMNTALAFRVLDVVKAVNTARESVSKEYEAKVLKELAVLDNGKPVPDGNSPSGFKLACTPEEYKKVNDAFGDKLCEVKVTKLTQKTIEEVAVNFSPVELLALEPIYTKLELTPNRGSDTSA